MRLDDAAIAGVPRVRGEITGVELYPVVGEAEILMDGRKHHVYIAGIDTSHASLHTIGISETVQPDGRIRPTFYWLDSIEKYMPLE